MEALYAMLKPGGMLYIDHYTWNLSYVTKLATVIRPIVIRLPPVLAGRIIDALVNVLFPLHWAVRGIRPAQMLLSRFSPVLVFFQSYPELTKHQHYAFSRLDTYDSLMDWYKHVRTPGQIERTLETLGAVEINVWRGGNGVEARCKKPL